ncbi:myosin-1-like [Sitophilus oryzae]|uniref:Myosin-1-like n=1 Tax=Sitophilus oryzae TaxID=7048 RepID=A0A6J2YRU6_SITOR|nr:myosin-1-like [Sitophilus oryzae]
MNATNMLSANKVKLHGMTSKKWTTKDKITQYKGLIKLYTRDRKIIEMDTGVAEKKQIRELKKLQKEIEQNKHDLDSAIRGDKQKLRNTLAEHREMQLAYQYSQPEKVIEMVEQVNFNKRKSKDLLLHKKQLKTKELIDLKLHYAEVEDILKFEGLSWQCMFPSEKQAQIITGKVQDAILKKEAAIVIRHSYKEMIAIMKKDALYFDAILEAIRNDGINQGNCMINATKLGQLATEYLDDRRQEFKVLEKIVKRDLASRRIDLENVSKRVLSFGSNIKNLLRRDSDLNLGKVQLKPSESFTGLQLDLKDVEMTLTYLKNAIFVPSLEAIYPCLQEQLRQKERLTEMVAKCEASNTELMTKSNHAASIKSELENTMVETTNQYKESKTNFLKEIGEQEEQIESITKLTENRHSVLAKIRVALKHLQLLANLLSVEESKDRSHRMRRQIAIAELVEKPAEDEIDVTKIIPDLVKKFTKLAQQAKDFLEHAEREEGYKSFERMMYESTKTMSMDYVISEESLIDSVFTDHNILTRADIKKQSEEIVQANQVSDDFVPDKKKKKRFS